MLSDWIFAILPALWKAPSIPFQPHRWDLVYTIDWHGLKTTADLIAIWALQIKTMHINQKEAADWNTRSWVEAAKQYAAKHVCCLISGQYAQGELILVALKGPGIVCGSNLPKSADRWAGPFRIVKRYALGSYQLEELDSSVLKYWLVI